jgi:hypothetical protein
MITRIIVDNHENHNQAGLFRRLWLQEEISVAYSSIASKDIVLVCRSKKTAMTVLNKCLEQFPSLTGRRNGGCISLNGLYDDEYQRSYAMLDWGT